MLERFSRKKLISREHGLTNSLGKFWSGFSVLQQSEDHLGWRCQHGFACKQGKSEKILNIQFGLMPKPKLIRMWQW